MSEFVKHDDKVLILSADKVTDNLQDFILEVRKAVGDLGETFVENVDNFLNCTYFYKLISSKIKMFNWSISNASNLNNLNLKVHF